MDSKRFIAVCCGIFFLLLFLLFGGIYRDREFNDPTLFWKYKPAAQFFFQSPIGEPGRSLSPEEWAQEERFEEFTGRWFMSHNRDFLDIVLIASVQLSLSCFAFACCNMQRPWWHLPLHMLGNFLLTYIGFVFILVFDASLCTFLLTSGILLINYFTARPVWKNPFAKAES